ncbi:hypothetical protein EMPS_11248 [Entomortierella parvispora]|uniref:Transmembrane protein n=1 Tax=Entomortierella parvispora TaxID=205924 RepID=A0A9P3HLB5_9FUNG|nr:hypothetical protein EMPS_11248 [Entomortierella parvispora]
MLDFTLSVVAAVALANLGRVQAQNGSGSVTDPVESTPASVSPTTPVESHTPIATTTTLPIVTTTTETPIITTTTTTAATLPSSSVTPTPSPTTTSVYVPPATTHSQLPPPITGPGRSTTIETSSVPTSTSTVGPATGGTSSSTSSNVPAIVGSIAGVAALIIIVATSVICYRRSRRNNRELTFDALQGMSGPGSASGKRQSFNYLTHADSPTVSGRAAVGLNSVTSGGYDDGYDYEMQSNSGYPVQNHNYNPNNYDGYAGGSPHPGYHPSPTIFQEDLLQHQASVAASSLPVAASFAAAGRGRTGFDQNLPEVMYNGVEDHAAATGYYNDADIYHQQGWSGQPADGHVGSQGLWVANPEALRRREEEAEYYNHINTIYGETPHNDNELLTTVPVPPTQFASAHSLESTTLASNGGEVSPTRNKFRSSGNPQTLPEDSPILKSSTLRGGGEVFAQESAARSVSPRIAVQEVAATSSNSSPRLGHTREMKSFEISRQAPSRPSGEHVQSYAADYVRERPSVDVGFSTTPADPDSPESPLNPNKSLRTLRREDWS